MNNINYSKKKISIYEKKSFIDNQKKIFNSLDIDLIINIKDYLEQNYNAPDINVIIDRIYKFLNDYREVEKVLSEIKVEEINKDFLGKFMDSFKSKGYEVIEQVNINDISYDYLIIDGRSIYIINLNRYSKEYESLKIEDNSILYNDVTLENNFNSNIKAKESLLRYSDSNQELKSIGTYSVFLSNRVETKEENIYTLEEFNNYIKELSPLEHKEKINKYIKGYLLDILHSNAYIEQYDLVENLNNELDDILKEVYKNIGN